ncbi:response regulator transcription factor [Thermopolyspora sp. NPDC052614]|uniref:response regulator transcription factor n=1 Tax=Thermopolyspora sp. NPDC052614 TaxID=3155682 RepID=UPI00343C3A38
MRVLVVEDEGSLANRIAVSLRGSDIAVEVVHDGDEALRRLAKDGFDVIVLDGDPPSAGEEEIFGWIARERSRSRLLMLTKAGDVMARIEALSQGADDCIAKPFAVAELVARVRALGRRRV